MKVGISVRIDVTKIDKTRLYKGAKGTYLDLTTFLDTDQKDQYENNGFISQSVDKEEREQGVKTPILGNVKVFFLGETERVQQQTNNEWMAEHEANSTELEDDIPF